MKDTMLKPLERLLDLTRSAHIKVFTRLADYIESSTPRERRLMFASSAITFTSLCVATSAHADTGIAGMADTAAAQAQSLETSGGKILAAIGFGGAGYGAINWIKKGREGENSHIKASQIFVPIVAGAACGATGFMLVKAGETVGIQSSSQGQLPQ